jgi:hypothetical protein
LTNDTTTASGNCICVKAIEGYSVLLNYKWDHVIQDLAVTIANTTRRLAGTDFSAGVTEPLNIVQNTISGVSYVVCDTTGHYYHDTHGCICKQPKVDTGAVVCSTDNADWLTANASATDVADFTALANNCPDGWEIIRTSSTAFDANTTDAATDYACKPKLHEFACDALAFVIGYDDAEYLMEPICTACPTGYKSVVDDFSATGTSYGCVATSGDCPTGTTISTDECQAATGKGYFYGRTVTMSDCKFAVSYTETAVDVDSYACTNSALYKITPSIDAANDTIAIDYSYSCHSYELNTENRSSKRPLCYTPAISGTDCAAIAGYDTDGTTPICTAFPTTCGSAMECDVSDNTIATECQEGFFLIDGACLSMSTAPVTSICNDTVNSTTSVGVVVYKDYNLNWHYDCVPVAPTDSDHVAMGDAGTGAASPITAKDVFTTIALHSTTVQG